MFPHGFIANVRVLAEARLGADSQEPFVGLFVFHLNCDSSDNAVKNGCPLSGGGVRPVCITSQKIGCIDPASGN